MTIVELCDNIAYIFVSKRCDFSSKTTDQARNIPLLAVLHTQSIGGAALSIVLS